MGDAMTQDPDELVTCAACGAALPAAIMCASLVNGQCVCGRCWGEAADDDEFEDAGEHNRD